MTRDQIFRSFRRLQRGRTRSRPAVGDSLLVYVADGQIRSTRLFSGDPDDVVAWASFVFPPAARDLRYQQQAAH